MITEAADEETAEEADAVTAAVVAGVLTPHALKRLICCLPPVGALSAFVPFVETAGFEAGVTRFFFSMFYPPFSFSV
jgi:hypothetical protein